jgi:putative zinc finger/helix-turn-helix YgiT family protein
MKETAVELNLHTYECPNCDSNNIDTQMSPIKFKYGTGNKALELEVLVPVRKCNNCGFEYVDSEAEDLKHAAICHHLKVMAPAEVEAIRKQYELSRAQFAQATRIGEASLSRWETGELIQNAAYDDYLYLLQFPENMDRLEKRHTAQQRKQQGNVLPFRPGFKGRVLSEAVVAAKSIEARAFQLRK